MPRMPMSRPPIGTCAHQPSRNHRGTTCRVVPLRETLLDFCSLSYRLAHRFHDFSDQVIPPKLRHQVQPCCALAEL